MPHRLNRSLLLLLSLLAVAAGVLGLLLGLGAFTDAQRHRPVFSNPIGRFLGRDGGWVWPVIGAVGLLLAYLGLRWLVAQLRNDRAGDLELERGHPRGRTELASSAATDALSSDIQGYRGVSSVHARLLGDPHHPDLVVTVSLHDRAALAAVRQRIEGHALARFRQALDLPDLHARLELRPTTKTASRVT